MSEQWVPHQPETWPWRIGRLKKSVIFQIWHGHNATPQFTERKVAAGSTVKIVMVSRLGDVGITDDLTADHGYHARLPLKEIEPTP